MCKVQGKILHQYRIKHTFALASIIQRLVCKSYADFDIQKMEEQAIWSEKLPETDFDL